MSLKLNPTKTDVDFQQFIRPHPYTGCNVVIIYSVELNILIGGIKMAILVRVYPKMDSRPCRFCLSLQEDSVFADFEVDEDGHAFLRRISFDGYGCCHGEFKRMALGDSRLLVDSVERGALQDPQIEVVLRTYFKENADVIWSDALADHELL